MNKERLDRFFFHFTAFRKKGPVMSGVDDWDERHNMNNIEIEIFINIYHQIPLNSVSRDIFSDD